jgi:uncharacterized membrane protein YkoI
MARMTQTGIIFVSIGFSIALAIAPPVLSQESSPAEPHYSLDDAVALVKEQIGGKILRAETKRQGDRTIYQVRVMTDDGRVRTIDVDAQDGIEE